MEDGSTVSDWTPQEQSRGITIGSAVVSCRWSDTEITIVDTPGHVDFTIEVERCLTVLDGAVLVLSGPDGVQAQTLTVWQQAQKRSLPALAFINKLDRPGFDDERLQDEIRERLGVEPLPMQVPVACGADGVTVLDVLTGRVYRWPITARMTGLQEPEELVQEPEEQREPPLRQAPRTSSSSFPLASWLQVRLLLQRA